MKRVFFGLIFALQFMNLSPVHTYIGNSRTDHRNMHRLKVVFYSGIFLISCLEVAIGIGDESTRDFIKGNRLCKMAPVLAAVGTLSSVVAAYQLYVHAKKSIKWNENDQTIDRAHYILIPISASAGIGYMWLGKEHSNFLSRFIFLGAGVLMGYRAISYLKCIIDTKSLARKSAFI